MQSRTQCILETFLYSAQNIVIQYYCDNNYYSRVCPLLKAGRSDTPTLLEVDFVNKVGTMNEASSRKHGLCLSMIAQICFKS